MPKKWMLTVAVFFITFSMTINAHAAPLWNLEVGQRWIYEERNTLGQFLGTLECTVVDVVSRDSSVFGITGYENYFKLQGDIQNIYVRATENAIYGWSDYWSLPFMGKVGADTEVSGVEHFTYLGTSVVSVPYGVGTYTAYGWKANDIPDVLGDGPFWYDYFVPGLGKIQLIDTHGNITKLVNIIPPSTSVPEPATMLFIVIGLMGLAGIRRKFEK